VRTIRCFDSRAANKSDSSRKRPNTPSLNKAGGNITPFTGEARMSQNIPDIGANATWQACLDKVKIGREWDESLRGRKSQLHALLMKSYPAKLSRMFVLPTRLHLYKKCELVPGTPLLPSNALMHLPNEQMRYLISANIACQRGLPFCKAIQSNSGRHRPFSPSGKILLKLLNTSCIGRSLVPISSFSFLSRSSSLTALKANILSATLPAVS
jgi:hypothetical protein